MTESEQLAVVDSTIAIATEALKQSNSTGKSFFQLFGGNLSRKIDDLITARFGYTVICGALADNNNDERMVVRIMASSEIEPKFHEVEGDGILNVANNTDAVVMTKPDKFNNSRVEVFNLASFNDSFFARRSIVDRLNSATYDDLMNYLIQIEEAVNEHS